MPFEPLRTDEKLEQPVKRAPDMDTQMLFGCSGFIIGAVGGYALAVWPWFVFQGAEQLVNVGLSLLLGLLPAAVLGIYSTRRFGLAGTCGFVGGALSTGIFLYLRIQQVFLAALAEQAPRPDYPQMFMYLVPLAWILTSVLLGFGLLPKEEAP